MKYAQLDTQYKRRPHRIFKAILDAWARPEAPRILDVGCASGIIGQLRGSKENVIGIERDPELAALACRHCEKVYPWDLDQTPLDRMEERGFDLIFCTDVLEHLIDPAGTLASLKGLLADEGRLIVSVPNIAQLPYRFKLLAGRFDYAETGVMDRTHLHFYTRRTAAALLKEARFSIERFYPAGTVVSFINIFPSLLAAQLIFICRKTGTE